jgi:SAM-dependent methyltransferase
MKCHPLPRRSHRDRSQFLRELAKVVSRAEISKSGSVLVIGGMQEDADVLRRCGFTNITLSNIESAPHDSASQHNLPIMAIDAECIDLPNGSYDTIFVHEVIHHCRSPHRALCEMLRVARRHVIMMEPNDSAFMRLLCRLRFSFPYEVFAVVDNDYICGGVRNSDVPNFIFRWNRHEVYKTTSSFLAEYTFGVDANPYWDFGIEEKDLAYRIQTRIGSITKLIGAKNFIHVLHLAQAVFNRIPVVRAQGNKFLCCVRKETALQPWLIWDSDGQIQFRKSYQQKLE